MNFACEMMQVRIDSLVAVTIKNIDRDFVTTPHKNDDNRNQRKKTAVSSERLCPSDRRRPAAPTQLERPRSEPPLRGHGGNRTASAPASSAATPTARPGAKPPEVCEPRRCKTRVHSRRRPASVRPPGRGPMGRSASDASEEPRRNRRPAMRGRR